MHNLAFVREINTHKLQWEFDIQMNHLISARRPGLIIMNNKKNGISILVGYAKAIIVEEQQWYDLTDSSGVGNGVYTFLKGISLRVNVIIRPEFKLTMMTSWTVLWSPSVILD